MNNHQEVRCYAVRRLNPFLGVLRVVETALGSASTANGLVWHIELLADKQIDWRSRHAALSTTGAFIREYSMKKVAAARV